MIERRYRCNLCRDEKQPDEMFGLHWTSRETVQSRDPLQCETHVCVSCMKQLVEIWDNYAENKQEDA